MKKIDEILSDSFRFKGRRKTLESPLVCFYAKEVGKGSYDVISFCNGVLKLRVSSSSAASDLQFREQEIIDKINEKMTNSPVKKIKMVFNTGT